MLYQLGHFASLANEYVYVYKLFEDKPIAYMYSYIGEVHQRTDVAIQELHRFIQISVDVYECIYNTMSLSL